MNCIICNTEFRFNWTDSHGIGACVECGAPHVILEEGKQLETPIIALKDSGVELAKKYWLEKKMRVFPACYDMIQPQYNRPSYSGATVEEVEQFYDWLDAQNGESE